MSSNRVSTYQPILAQIAQSWDRERYLVVLVAHTERLRTEDGGQRFREPGKGRIKEGGRSKKQVWRKASLNSNRC